jgi:hypothetical protein
MNPVGVRQNKDHHFSSCLACELDVFNLTKGLLKVWHDARRAGTVALSEPKLDPGSVSTDRKTDLMGLCT